LNEKPIQKNLKGGAQMKRQINWKKIAICFVILGIVLSLSGDLWAAEKKKLRFVFIPKVVHPWYDTVITGAKEFAAFITKCGDQEIVIDYIAPPQADVVVHNNYIERAIATKPDGLAVAILDAATNAPLLKTAMQQGIYTIIYDSVPPEGMKITAVGCDYIEQGAQMAEELAKTMNFKGKVGILIGAPTAPNHQLRVEGVKQVFKKYPGMEIVAEGVDNDSIEEAQKAAAAIISGNPEITGMIGVNAAAPIGIGIAISEAGKKGIIKFVGEEDLPEMIKLLSEGVASATSVQRTKQIGWSSALCLWLGVNGRMVPDKINTGTFLVFPNEIESYKNKL
jgi:ribose transport system substrate-binding protein